MNKIVLITTKGCDGCSIMKNAIYRAIHNSSKDIDFEIKDISEIDTTEKRKLKLTDFPTTIFYKYNDIVRKEVGTRPYIIILRWIDIDFK